MQIIDARNWTIILLSANSTHLALCVIFDVASHCSYATKLRPIASFSLKVDEELFSVRNHPKDHKISGLESSTQYQWATTLVTFIYTRLWSPDRGNLSNTSQLSLFMVAYCEVAVNVSRVSLGVHSTRGSPFQTRKYLNLTCPTCAFQMLYAGSNWFVELLFAEG